MFFFMKAIPENPENKDRLRQITILVERHNFLVEEVSKLEDSFLSKELALDDFKKEYVYELNLIKEDLARVNSLIKKAENMKNEISSEFKEVVKVPLLKKLERRVDNLGYENFIFREELWRKFNI